MDASKYISMAKYYVQVWKRQNDDSRKKFQ